MIGQNCRRRLALLALALLAPGAASAEKGIAPGRLLVASRELRDPSFRETVVLIVEHGFLEGTVGLILNRPSEVKLQRLLPELEGAAERQELVYRGGPVEPLQVTVLVRSESEVEAAVRVFDDVHFSGNRELFERLATTTGSESSFRAYAGYAGWAPGQLAAEIAVGGWLVLEADTQMVFEEPSDKLWPRLILHGSAEWASRGRLTAPPGASLGRYRAGR